MNAMNPLPPAEPASSSARWTLLLLAVHGAALLAFFGILRSPFLALGEMYDGFGGAPGLSGGLFQWVRGGMADAGSLAAGALVFLAADAALFYRFQRRGQTSAGWVLFGAVPMVLIGFLLFFSVAAFLPAHGLGQ